jgi:hypothetical protein
MLNPHFVHLEFYEQENLSKLSHSCWSAFEADGLLVGSVVRRHFMKSLAWEDIMVSQLKECKSLD